MVDERLKQALKDLIFNVVLDEEDAEDLVREVEQAIEDFASSHSRYVAAEGENKWYLIKLPKDGDPNLGTVQGTFHSEDIVESILKALN